MTGYLVRAPGSSPTFSSASRLTGRLQGSDTGRTQNASSTRKHPSCAVFLRPSCALHFGVMPFFKGRDDRPNTRPARGMRPRQLVCRVESRPPLHRLLPGLEAISLKTLGGQSWL